MALSEKEFNELCPGDMVYLTEIPSDWPVSPHWTIETNKPYKVLKLIENSPVHAHCSRKAVAIQVNSITAWWVLADICSLAPVEETETTPSCTCPWSMSVRGCECGAIKPYKRKAGYVF